jgi:hypothetical protein
VSDQAVTLTDFMAAVLARIGAPASAVNLAVLNGIAKSEGTGLSIWNPLDTTQGTSSDPGAGNYNSVGVKVFTNANAGIQATAETLLNGYYDAIVTGLREQQPLSYYTTGAAAHQLGIWQGGGDNSVAVRTLRGAEVAVLNAWAATVSRVGGLVGGGAPSTSSPPAAPSASTAAASSGPCKYDGNPINLPAYLACVEAAVAAQAIAQPGEAAKNADVGSRVAAGLSAAVTQIDAALSRGFWIFAGVGLVGFGVLLLVFEDLEEAGKAAAKTIASNPEVLAA